jgi:uncharacterized protein YbjT (DUF2867 family)
MTINQNGDTKNTPLILIAGATGYIGGRLLKRLEDAGYLVRCLARRPDFLSSRVGPRTEVLSGDVLEPKTLGEAMKGVHTAYYMVHSMGSAEAFEKEDRQAARNFAEAASKAGVKRIIYVGGLGNQGEELSSHLRSRHEVGEIFRTSGVEVIEFRASIVIGSGSLSFEMIRALVERLPVMVTPRWVTIPTQPIAVTDLLDYLIATLELPRQGDRIFEIGGADPVSYADCLLEYARQRGLHRLMIPVPVLTPRLSSLWLGLVTPLYARIGRKLVESIRHPTLVKDRSALEVFHIRPMGIRDAIAGALQNEEREFAETHWSDALSSGGPLPSWGGVKFGTRIVDSRSTSVPCPPSEAFKPIRRIGGASGWYYANWLWRIRGFLDLLVGGVGLRRGRRNPAFVVPGDTVDFWRVEAFEPDQLLRLAAEMRLPGRAWLQFEVEGDKSSSTVRQTAIFDPVGLFGLAYWYALWPIHKVVFAGMLRNVVKAVGRGA